MTTQWDTTVKAAMLNILKQAYREGWNYLTAADADEKVREQWIRRGYKGYGTIGRLTYDTMLAMLPEDEEEIEQPEPFVTLTPPFPQLAHLFETEETDPISGVLSSDDLNMQMLISAGR